MSNNQREIDNARNKLNSWQLGQTSKQYESGNNGPGTISTGKGDNGGMSYGTYQIETRKGTMKEYLQYSNNYNHQLDGLVPTTAAFNQKWKQLAASDPEFAKSQHSFIATQHYQPQLNKLKNNGYDFSDRGKAIQDMIWSTAVQYRNRTLKVFQRAEQESGLDFNTASNEEIIKAVQKSKLIHVNHDFVSSSHNVRQGVRNRIPREERSLLELDKYENLISRQKDNTINEKQPTQSNHIQEKPTQEKPEKVADKIEKTEKAEPSPQLSPQAQKFSQQCEEKLVECCNKKGITADSPQDFKNISMALTVKGLENGMTRVEKLDIESRNSVVMVFILSNEPHAKLASVSANEAVNIPVQQSIEKIQQMEQQKTQEQQMQHSQTQNMYR